MSWATKYRPQNFEDVIGQPLVVGALSSMIQHERVPHAMLFSGASGTGKTTTAKLVSRKLCDGDESRIIEIDAASHGGVEDVRNLISSLRYTFGNSVVILDEAHSMSRMAFNTLLVTLETPPPHVYFILVTTEPQKIPDTVLSRLVTFEFQRLTPQHIASRLLNIAEGESVSLNSEVAMKLAFLSEGNLRRAITLLEQATLSKASTVRELQELVGEFNNAPELLAHVISGDISQISQAVERAAMSSSSVAIILDALTDALAEVLRLKDMKPSVDEISPSEAILRSIADVVSRDLIFSSLRLLWDLNVNGVDTRESLPMLKTTLILMSRIFEDVQNRGQEIVETSQSMSDAELSLDDLTMV